LGTSVNTPEGIHMC